MRHISAYRVSVPKFNKMCAIGLFDDEKVELLNGVLTMMTSGPVHDFTVNTLEDLLKLRLPGEKWSVRTEQPVKLGRFWKPLPDIVVVRGTHRDFITRTPGPSDVALIVEVSDTTYAKDSGVKLRRYERSGEPHYWIVDLNQRRVEVREMGSRGLSVPVYYHENDEIPLVLDGHDHGRITVSEFLP